MRKMKSVKQLQIWMCFLICTTFLMLFVSNDSYLYDLYGKNDSTIFYMCGKAWMNGMMPYADFSDSKGPLLWLIYGIGYLISRYNYIGVFWLSCFLYACIFYYVYKISIIFLKNRNLSLVSTAIMSLVFFCPLIHNDIRAEDFCQLFIVLPLYWCCKVLYGDVDSTKKTLCYAAFWIGLSIAVCLMIKFTIAAMVSFFGLYLVFYARKYGFILRMTGATILGLSVVIVPFILYFLLTGNLLTFFYEYFIRTFVTVSNTNESLNYVARLWSYFTSPVPFLVFVVSLTSTAFFIYSTTKHRFFPFLSFVSFYLITLQNGIWHHYYIVCAAFSLFGIICFLQKTNFHDLLIKKTYLIISAAFFVCAAVNVIRFSMIAENFFLCDTDRRNQYYEFASIMCEKKNPKIVVLGMELGYGTPVNALPGCKFWARQTGATKEMVDCQWNAIINKDTDFVIVSNNDSESLIRLNELGYFPYKNVPYTLYAKEKVKQKKLVNISWKDVLMKKHLGLKDDI